MKKKFTNIVVFLAVLLGVVIGMPVWSQNLVVNPSFENTSSCPIGISEFSKALNWSSVNSGADTCSSPDLYAGCAPAIGGANSPNALIGFQNSRTGRIMQVLFCTKVLPCLVVILCLAVNIENI
jgi:hypothetical protein